MICMSSIGFSYTPDLVPFLEIISDTFYIAYRKKQTPVILVTTWLLEGHGSSPVAAIKTRLQLPEYGMSHLILIK